MKLVMCVLFAIVSAPAFAHEVQITKSNIPFIYESRAQIPAPDHKLAAYISTDYANARDEFTKHDLYERIKPVIENDLRNARSERDFYIKVRSELADYNFNKQAFPTGLSSSSYIPMSPPGDIYNPYAVMFSNSKNIRYIHVPLNSASKLSGYLRDSRVVDFVIHGRIKSVKETTLGFNQTKVIYMRATKIQASLSPTGILVGIKTIH